VSLALRGNQLKTSDINKTHWPRQEFPKSAKNTEYVRLSGVGFIALFGLAADDGIVMTTYMRETLNRRTIRSVEDIRRAIYDAGVKRIRPCTMTTVTTLVALLPVLLSTGRGADVARAMALPVFGGMLIEPFTTFIVPTLYCAYIEFKMRAGLQDDYWQDDVEYDASSEGPAA
jgi:Cu(I)/Ag(I) efflux system membrane protein CusA/SilA